MRSIVFTLLIISSFALSAQNTGCNHEESNQFDFWLGEWEVFNPAGNKVGENHLIKQYENCLIQENWVSQGANRGTSYNYYDPNDKSWHQLWIDNQGGILNLKGQFKEDRMVLKSESIKGRNGTIIYNQISWIDNPDGTVSQIWEVYNEKDELVNTVFHGIYKPKK